MPAATDRPAALPQLTPAQADDLIALKLNEVCAGIADWKLPLTIRGILGELPAARYNGGKLYRVPLVDAAAPASITYLDVKESLLEQAHAEPGDLVRATGIVVPNLFKGAVSFRLDVVAIEHEEPAALPAPREGANTLSILRRLAMDRRPFPDTGRPSLTLIHPAASDARVAGDFRGALRQALPDAAIRSVPVSMHDPAAIAEAVRAAGLDIVVLIRGGGDAASFAVFEDPRVLEALAACRAYRVLGLGHTGDRTLAELACDHAAATPTAAGEHVRRGIESHHQARSAAGRLQELQESLMKKDIELARRPLVSGRAGYEEAVAARLQSEGNARTVSESIVRDAKRTILISRISIAISIITCICVIAYNLYR